MILDNRIVRHHLAWRQSLHVDPRASLFTTNGGEEGFGGVHSPPFVERTSGAERRPADLWFWRGSLSALYLYRSPHVAPCYIVPRMTTTQATETSKFRVGERVVTRSTVKPKRYASRSGTVAEVRRVAPHSVEIGVKLGSGISWFDPLELEHAGRHAPAK